MANPSVSTAFSLQLRRYIVKELFIRDKVLSPSVIHKEGFWLWTTLLVLAIKEIQSEL